MMYKPFFIGISLVCCTLSVAVWGASPVRVNEVAPSESNDWIEFYVAVSTPLGGWKVREGSTVLWTFPPGFTPIAGDYIVLHSSPGGTNDSVIADNNPGYWDFFTTDSGWTATDNVITLSSATGTVLDALVFANYNGSYTGNDTWYRNSVSDGQWTGTTWEPASQFDAQSENSAAANIGAAPGKSICRDNASTDSDNAGLSKNDWHRCSALTRGSVNPVPTDNQPPASIIDLSVANPSNSSLDLTFTAPAEDGGPASGSVARYVIRMATYPILTQLDFFNAADFSNSFIPQSPGNTETLTLAGLSANTTYWFIVESEEPDDDRKQGGVSSPAPVSGLTSPDNQPPNAVTDLSAALVNSLTGAVNLIWTAPSDPPSQGAVTAYVVRYATFSVASLSNDTLAWWNAALGVAGEPTTSAPGTTESMTITGLPSDTTVYFHIRTQDTVAVSALNTPVDVAAFVPPHLLISEFASGIGSSGEEFLELYNPSTSALSLAGLGLQIRRRSGTGSSDSLLVDLSGASTTTIGANGFYLVATSTAATFGVAPDAVSSSQITRDGTVYLTVSGANSVRQAIDRVSYGSVTDSEIEESPAPSLLNDQSLERKPGGGAGGSHGNSADTNRSGSDFDLIAAVADIVPQNSFSGAEPDHMAPAGISDLTAVAGSDEGEIRLSWTSPGDDGMIGSLSGGQFVVKYSSVQIISNGDFESPSFPVSTVAVSTTAVPGSVQGLTVAGLKPGTSYWFAIKTRDDSGNFSIWNSSADVSTVNTAAYGPALELPPGTPSWGTATGLNRRLLVPFSSPFSKFENIEFYHVYRATYAFTGANDLPVTKTTHANALAPHDTGPVLSNGLTYYFRIQSQGGGPNFFLSPLSAAVTGQPRVRPPSSVTATHLGTAVELSWSASGDSGDGNFIGYNVYRSTIRGGPYSRVSSLISETTYQDTSSILAVQDYYYVVRSTENHPSTLPGFFESIDSVEAVTQIDQAAPVISHTPVGLVLSVESGLTLSASAVDFRDGTQSVSGRVQDMSLFYRVSGSTGPFLTLGFQGNGFGTSSASGTVTVSANFLRQVAAAGGFTYYISAADGVNTATWPGLPRVFTVVVESPGSGEIGPSGGTVRSLGGFAEVEIMTNALDGQVMITVNPLDRQKVVPGTAGDAISVQGGYTGQAVTAAEFAPDGLRFSVPVHIKLKYLDTDGDGYPEFPPGGNDWELPNTADFHVDRLRIYLLSGGRWVLIGGKREGDRIAVKTNHFSTYALFPGAVSGAVKAVERFVTPNNDGVNDFATFGLSALKVTVYDVTGKEMWTGGGDGINAIQWPGTDSGGAVVESGSYIYQAEQANGSRTYGVIVVAR